MRTGRARWLPVCIALLLLPALAACGGKGITLPTTGKVDAATNTAIIATSSGPTPTPLANVLRVTPTPPRSTSPPSAPTAYNAPAAAPSASIPRVVVEQFYDAVLARRNIAAFLAPQLRATTNGDGYAILNAQPPMRFFSVDSQEIGADGATAAVGSTLSTASGTTKPQFVLTAQGTTWLIARVTT
jgi:predicted small lipoprotein YifL